MALALTVLALAGQPAYHPDNPGCQSHRCDARVTRRWHRLTRRRWRRVTGPWRPWLASVRACESGGDYATNTGNGHYGAYQFDWPTWRSVGGKVLPHLAEPLEQDYRAVRLRLRAGTGPWPVCG